MLTSVCIFCAATAVYFDSFLGDPGGSIAVLSLLAFYLLCSQIAPWVETDAMQREIELPYDFDSLLFLVWPYAALIYLCRTRGWDALAPIGFAQIDCRHWQVVGFRFSRLIARVVGGSGCALRRHRRLFGGRASASEIL